MALATEEHAALDISSAGVVLDYTYDGATARQVICRVTLGTNGAPIAGGAIYTLHVDLNGSRVSPDSQVAVAHGITKAIVQSREILLVPGDEIVVTLDGPAGDTAVATVATLVDLTPLTKAEIYGTGAISVDHNYGAVDRYRYMTSTQVGISNAQVQAFLREDYEAGNRSAAFVRGEAQTRPDGRWEAAMMLDPGSYVLVFFKAGIYGPDVASLTVA